MSKDTYWKNYKIKTFKYLDEILQENKNCHGNNATHEKVVQKTHTIYKKKLHSISAN